MLVIQGSNLARLFCGLLVLLEQLNPSAKRDGMAPTADPRIHAHMQECHEYVWLCWGYQQRVQIGSLMHCARQHQEFTSSISVVVICRSRY